METGHDDRAADIAGPEEPPTNSELFAAARGNSRTMDGVEAVHEIGRVRPTRWAEVLREVVRAPDSPAAVRAAGALELARSKTDANEAALADALDPSEPDVLRRAAEALGRIGERGTLRRLATLPDLGGPVARSVDFARTLIAYRLGLTEPRLERPRGVADATPQRGRGTTIDVTELDPSDADGLLEPLRSEVAGIDLANRSALELRCRDTARALVAFTTTAQERPALSALERASGVLAVVFEWTPSLSRFDLAEFVLAHPRGDATLQVFGARATGTVSHVGEIDLEATRARFSLRGLDRPHATPLALEGTIDRASAAVTFSRATVDLEAPARREDTVSLREVRPT